MYKVSYVDTVEDDLKVFDKKTRKKILEKVEKDLEKDPCDLGKALTGAFKGYFRYRFGNYRVIYKVSKKEILIIVLRISHRKSVYN